MNRWNLIRDFYRSNHDEIMNTHPALYGVDPYWWDGLIEMTPIERSTWCDIRSSGAVFYPQYPVLKYFVDFGNPILKIAIECDGKYFHDPVKDKKRDEELKNIGWTVYRFTGSDCLKAGQDIDDEDGLRYEMTEIEKLLQTIRMKQ